MLFLTSFSSLRQDDGIKEGSSVGAVLCGHKDMCVSVTEYLKSKGVDPSRILLNF